MNNFSGKEIIANKQIFLMIFMLKIISLVALRWLGSSWVQGPIAPIGL